MSTIQDLGKVAYFNKGSYNSEINYEINDVVNYNGSSYVSLLNNNRGNLPTNVTYWSIVASKGDKGDTGKPFVIEKTYTTIESMVADYDNMNVNDYVMISGDIEQEQNATLWTKTETEVSPYKWVYLADFSGASGITGATPNIQIGTVTEGNEPAVTRRAGSSNENPILDFVLKTGAKGDTGETGNGISSITKTGTSGLVDTYTVTYTNGTTSTINVTNGNGITTVAKTGTSGLVDTYTITFDNGNTSTFTVTNGEDANITRTEFDNLKQEVTDLENNSLTSTPTIATSYDLYDSAKAKARRFLTEGNSTQETTTGKNLCPTKNFSSTSNALIVSNNATFGQTVEGILVEAGTYTASFDVTALPSLDYRIVFIASSDNTQTQGNANLTNIISDSVQAFTTLGRKTLSITVTQNCYLYIRCIPAGFTLDNIQIEKSSTATSYEPYTGGQTSPNPSYEQPIKSAGDNGSITEEIINKNFFTGNVTNKTSTIDYINGKIIFNSNSPSSNQIIMFSKGDLKENETYTVSFDVVSSSNGASLTFDGQPDSATYGEGYFGDYNFTANTTKTKVSITGIVSKNLTEFRFFRISSASGYTTATVEISNIQIEKGSTASEYTAHELQNYNIAVQQPMRSIGNIKDIFFKNTQDSLYYDSNLTLNTWYEKHYIERIVLDGTETWKSDSTSLFYIDRLNTKRHLANSICSSNNYLFYDYLGGSVQYGIRVGGAQFIQIKNIDYTNIDDFKAYLAEQYANETPVYVDYILETPIDLPCTQAQINILENLPSTYRNITHIHSEDETPAYVDLEYVQDTKTYIDNAINNAISNLS